MKFNVSMYRVVTVPTVHLKASAGLELDVPNDKSEEKIKESFGPHLAPGFKIFWNVSDTYPKTLCGMEAMRFDIPEPDIASAGLVECDPVNQDDIHRLDGALQSELRRFGIYVTRVEDHEWRMYYNVKGGGPSNLFSDNTEAIGNKEPVAEDEE